MANCPKCKTRLSFFQVAFLSRSRNWVKCSSCQSYCATDKNRLVEYGVVSGFSGASGGGYGRSILESEYLSWLLLFILVLFIYATFQFYKLHKSMEFKIVARPKKVGEYAYLDDLEHVDVPSRNDPNEYLKYQYRNYSDENLREVAFGNDYREDARAVAEELLNEKYPDSTNETNEK